jgi:hypothetical protein
LPPQDEPPGGPPGPASHRFGLSGVIASIIVAGIIIAIGIPQAVFRFVTEFASAALR